MSVYLAVFIVLAYLVWIKCIYYWHRRTLVKSLKHVMNILSSKETNGADIRALVVTAHPDDECMFFAPTIIRLVELNASVHLLCLSEGNYYNQGSQRKQELLNSCAMLGIPDSRITIVDHKKLPDDPKAEWSISLASSVIVKHIRAHSFNMVLTFDGSGVSGHANHVAIHKAVRLLFALPCDCRPLQEIPLLPGPSPQLAAALMSPLYYRLTGLQSSQRGHVLSSHSAPLVSLPLHRLLSVHVREHIPNDPTRTKEPEDLLGLSHSDPDALIVTLSHCVTTRILWWE
ncbi:N-acetylglucosaminyl-phosphatidylinositol de-N-acetylase isoform X1 [Micropterus salmoides]|uniref:N-acetylglucosaminyl-phosphatidylinositol de-N-acetylase isoform X1 n=1 Tax=Micropterus salmoides TaxID=27706 RepID=UPI0018EDCB19|nr:N-acetylglucosaminyl-phosphatidylinositol de-N-acetylase isoform X1 [Micropterus salmoides]